MTELIFKFCLHEVSESSEHIWLTLLNLLNSKLFKKIRVKARGKIIIRYFNIVVVIS